MLDPRGEPVERKGGLVSNLDESDHIAATLRKAIMQDPVVNGARIRISMLGPDSVALEGEVSSLAQKEAAGQICRRLAPGCEVDNSLTISVNRPGDDAELTRLANEELEKQVLPASVGVKVEGGIGWLMGTAESRAIADQAHKATARVPGIREVRDERLAIYSGQVVEAIGPERTEVGGKMITQSTGTQIEVPIDDAAIANEIVRVFAALMPPEHGDPASVSVTDATVRLFGVVRTRAESSMAERLARTVPGVRHVVNRLYVTDGSTGGDEAKAAEIRHALGYPKDHASPVDIKVFVVEDQAYLFGSVDFPEQALQAEAIARRTPGIDHVFSSLEPSERHFRPGKGPGHAAEDAISQLERETGPEGA